MKTKCLLFAVLIMMSVLTSAYSGEGSRMTVVAGKGSDVFRVIYQGSASGKVKLKILDSRGRNIRSISVAGKDGFICPLNFHGLSSGNYTIQLTDDFGTHQQRVTYVPLYDRKVIHVSKIVSEDAKYLFSVGNAQNEPIMVRIYDRQKILLYSARKTFNGDFAQVFRLESGLNHCTFEISDAAGNERVFVF